QSHMEWEMATIRVRATTTTRAMTSVRWREVNGTTALPLTTTCSLLVSVKRHHSRKIRAHHARKWRPSTLVPRSSRHPPPRNQGDRLHISQCERPVDHRRKDIDAHPQTAHPPGMERR